jgi:hypothetical protein
MEKDASNALAYLKELSDTLRFYYMKVHQGKPCFCENEIPQQVCRTFYG